MHVWKNQKRLRCGYTTGTCAQAAAKAAATGLLTGKVPEQIEVVTPSGISLVLPTVKAEINNGKASCGIVKDGGDDPDVTSGLTIYVSVERTERGIEIDGGTGIGRVTAPGLWQKPGMAAINRVPLQMIREAVCEVMEELDYEGGLKVLIYAPEGEKVAKKTFNPRLGIEGGISILGTSGIVEPMSEKALVDTIETQMKIIAAKGKKELIGVPGRYGEQYLKTYDLFPDWEYVICSNYIGETIDLACGMEFKELLLAGNFGKLVKLAAGIMNTHSRTADGRMEIIGVYAALAGADQTLVKEILSCITTDQALELCENAGIRQAVLAGILAAIDEKVAYRADDQLKVGVVLFSEKMGYLGMTRSAERMCR